MEGSATKCIRAAYVAIVMMAAAGSCTVHAQDSLDDVAGRRSFERGREAFDRADYESALIYFRHAYRLSRRSELQYNIGIAAARLQREQEALEAFELYLAKTEAPKREAEVRGRIEALKQSIAEREATERALAEAATQYRGSYESTADDTKWPTSTLAGATTLGAMGVGGVVAMGVGLARGGNCTREIEGRCVVEQSTTAWTWVYGGLGAAALAGSAAWFAITAKRRKDRRTTTSVSIGPSGLRVSGTY